MIGILLPVADSASHRAVSGYDFQLSLYACFRAQKQVGHRRKSRMRMWRESWPAHPGMIDAEEGIDHAWHATQAKCPEVATVISPLQRSNVSHDDILMPPGYGSGMGNQYNPCHYRRRMSYGRPD